MSSGIECDKAICEDCKMPYQEFGIDTDLPVSQWLLIHPEGTGGLLCANCMVRRASRLPGIIVARMVLEVSYPAYRENGWWKRITKPLRRVTG